MREALRKSNRSFVFPILLLALATGGFGCSGEDARSEGKETTSEASSPAPTASPGAGDVGPALPPVPAQLEAAAIQLRRTEEDLSAWDRNRDGKLSEEEFLQRYIDRHRRRFQRLDLDKDGQLTLSELNNPPPPGTPPSSVP